MTVLPTRGAPHRGVVSEPMRTPVEGTATTREFVNRETRRQWRILARRRGKGYTRSTR
jgi:hypothetical protein